MSLFDFINVPIGYVLKFFDQITGNYVFAILLFAIVVEILLLPLGIKQQKTQIKQARLRPKEAAIRKKYAGRDDKVTQQKMQNELFELYQRENVSPMGGCVPLLIQMPIILILYNIIIDPLRYICGLSSTTVSALRTFITSSAVDGGLGISIHQNLEMVRVIKEQGLAVFSGIEGFADKITSLDVLPDFTIFGGALDLSEVPSITHPSWLWAIPVLTFVVSFLSTMIIKKYTYQTEEAKQANAGVSGKIMEWSMPLLSVYITFVVSAVIGVYWIFKNILSVVKQIILARMYPIPQFTEADYKAAERELNMSGKQKKREQKLNADGKPAVRSLHHIDDDDFDDTKTKNGDSDKSTGSGASTSKPAPEKNGALAPAPLKDESDRSGKKADAKPQSGSETDKSEDETDTADTDKKSDD